MMRIFVARVTALVGMTLVACSGESGSEHPAPAAVTNTHDAGDDPEAGTIPPCDDGVSRKCSVHLTPTVCVQGVQVCEQGVWSPCFANAGGTP